MSDAVPIYSVRARCACGREFYATTVRAPTPGQAPIDRKCDECVDADFKRTPPSKAVRDPLEDGSLHPPRKVFGYDD